MQKYIHSPTVSSDFYFSVLKRRVMAALLREAAVPTAAASCTKLQQRDLNPTSVGSLRRRHKALAPRIGVKVRASAERPILDQPNWVQKVVGSLPFVGLALRLSAEEGGVGVDRLHYAEYCTRVENRLPATVKTALSDFQQAFGKVKSADSVAYSSFRSLSLPDAACVACGVRSNVAVASC